MRGYAFFLGLFLSCGIAVFPAEASYVDRIGAPYEEVYEAAKSLLEEAGIAHRDKHNGVIQSQWMEDVIMRERSFPFLGDAHKSYQRRYQVLFTFTPTDRYTEVEISIDFKYRSSDSGHATPWRKLDPVREESDLKRDYFHRLLLVIEEQRRSAV